MVKFYVNRIKQGKMKLKDIPPRWYEAVRQALIDEGWPVDSE